MKKSKKHKRKEIKFDKLNLGCGKDIKKGYVNLDSFALPGVDIVHNLNKYPWPFEDNTFKEIYCSEILEHLDDIIKPVHEFHRISKPNGKIIITVPIFTSSNAVNSPDHRNFFTVKTFDYFTGKDKAYHQPPKFKIIKKRILFHKALFPLELFFNLSESMQRFHNSFLCFLFPAMGLYFELEVLK